MHMVVFVRLYIMWILVATFNSIIYVHITRNLTKILTEMSFIPVFSRFKNMSKPHGSFSTPLHSLF